MHSQTLEGGFADPAQQAAQAFRAVMEAMARPGTSHAISGAMPPAPMSPAAGATLLTLCDSTTPLYLAGAYDTPDIRAWVAFHTGAPVATPATCQFALGDWPGLAPLADYPVGTPEYPDRSATLIVEMADGPAADVTLRGPGIKDSMCFALPEVQAFQNNARQYPLGLDFIFTRGDQLSALPRSTEVC